MFKGFAMAGMRFSTLSKSFCTGLNHVSRSRITHSFRPSIAFTNSSDPFLPPPPPNPIASTSVRQIVNTHLMISPLQSLVDNRAGHSEVPISDFSPTCLQNRELSSFRSWAITCPVLTSNISSFRAYSSFFGSNVDNLKGPSQAPEVTASSSVVNESNADQADVVGSDLVEKLKGAWQSAVDAAGYTGEKAKEASDELTPHVQQLLDSHPYLRSVIIPVGGTFIGTVLAWVVMPRVLRKLHKYSMQGPVSLLYGSSIQEQVPYDKSIWAALEDPVRYLITFMAFSQLGVMIAPTTIASQYIAQAWRGAVILSFVWFLHRWKANVFTRALSVQNIVGLDRDKLLALDKLSSVGLFVLGLMALAEACGVAVQSILTVGGVGGVATAFAARDILGNVLSGLSMQFSKPFSLGDTIKAGSIEGQVVEMGLTTTSLLNAEKFPVIVPNSLFSSQVIVNKSRAQWRAMVTKIPIRINDLEKIPHISEDIKSILKLNPKVSLGKEAPYCFLSRIESSYAELSVGCVLKHMSKDEFYSTEQDILLKAVEIIQKHGAALGSTLQDSTYQ